MKVGVITFWYSHENYGQLLQAYALQNYLISKGHDAFLIKFSNKTSPKARRSYLKILSNFRIINVFSILRELRERSKPNPIADELTKHPRFFDEFRNKHLRFSPSSYKNIEELRANPPEADIYITGSDQVWNYDFVKALDIFFLQFGKPTVKRFSYAASFGQTSVPDELKATLQQYLKTFDSVSVRESSGVEICHQLGVTNCHLLPDPTFLLSQKQWFALAETDKGFANNSKKKFFTYTLGNRPFDAKEQILTYISEKENSVNIHSAINQDYTGNSYPTIPQWLGYLANSDCVVTNSFHGVVFSIIFNKNFIALPSMKGGTVGMNSRIVNLLEKLGLSDHLIFDFNPETIDALINKNVAWSSVNDIIKDWKSESAYFLDFEKQSI